jgi:lipopolysaccharide/colanic/teichoic acid biosynthesis glycosyltransferase
MLRQAKSEWKLAKLLSTPDKELHHIYSISEFTFLVQHERVRADRNHTIFSLLLLSLNPENIHDKTVKDFIVRIKQHIREVDYLGWHDHHTLGILLPQTDSEGALRFTEHIKSLSSGIIKKSELIQYPAQVENKGKIANQLLNDFAPPIPVWKIILDKIGAIAGFIVFSPFFIFLPIYIKSVSPGPVFYSQTRIGYRGREFKFWKFRTMHSNTGTVSHNSHLKTLINSDLPMTKLDDSNDPRIIPGGRMIRKACIDEIPQIFNILKGDMSLVGPRPCIPYEAQEYLLWHKYRFDINPGLTGLWQVSGKNKLTFKQMIRLDINYSRSMSLLVDLKIIGATIPAIFKMIGEAISNKYKISKAYTGQNDVKRGNV